MKIYLDFNYAMTEFIGPHGIRDEDLASIGGQCEGVRARLKDARKQGLLPFLDLPHERGWVDEINRLAGRVREGYEDFILLGIGGSNLGAMALYKALAHPYHNLLPKEERGGPRIFFMENVDPEGIAGLLKVVDLDRAFINVVSKSGATVETAAHFLYLLRKVKERLGRGWRERFVITTDPKRGPLREIVEREGLMNFPIPEGVEGRYSVLSPVGLFPGAVMGIDIDALLRGAAFMDRQSEEAELWEDPACVMASLLYLTDIRRGKKVLVMMPYADALQGLGLWFRQLWAESVGKGHTLDGKEAHTGTTPIVALGTTDQHSQLQLYLEGPNDKLIIFLAVENFRAQVGIPEEEGGVEGIGYLGGHTFNQLIKLEREVTELALVKAGRPSMTIAFPEINPFTIGQFIYLMEVTTAIACGLYNVNPYDQPGVEEGKRFIYAIMGRKGYEAKGEEWLSRRKKEARFIL